MNNRKYHYKAVRKSNGLLAKFSSERDGGRFCLNYFSIFKQMENLNNIKSYLKIVELRIVELN